MKKRSLLMCMGSLVLAILIVGIILGLMKSAASASNGLATTSNQRFSAEPKLNGDGTKIAFWSNSDVLGQCILADQAEVWLYDTTTMTYTRLTTATSESWLSYNPEISTDGSTITFRRQFGQNLFGNNNDVVLFDIDTMTSTPIATTTASVNPGECGFSVNADGSKIAFWSDFDPFDQGIDQREIWLYDPATMTYTRITTGSKGHRGSLCPRINADGTRTVFYSDSDFLGQSIPKYQREIWLYDTTTMTYTRITTASDSSRGSFNPDLSADGTKIVFMSDSDFLGQGISNTQLDIWLYDTTTMTYTRITTASDPERLSRFPKINANGSKIVFESNSDFFNQGIPIEQNEIWLYDTTTMTLTRVTNSGEGRASYTPHISADGNNIAFTSDGDFFNQGIAFEQYEIWLYDVGSTSLTRITTAMDSLCSIYMPLILKNEFLAD